ncbi:MAG: MotA/TolQ/ExbB proton channel family protein [Parvibaculum sp.]
MTGMFRKFAFTAIAAILLSAVSLAGARTSAAQQADDAAAPAAPSAVEDMSSAGAGDELTGGAAGTADAALMDSEALPPENPYGLGALWAQGDYVSKGTLVILAIMSMGSWYILVIKLWEQRRLLAEGRTMRKKLASQPSMQLCAEQLPKNSAFRNIVEEALYAREQYQSGLGEQVTLIDWTGMSLNRSLDVVTSRLQTGLAFLATVGSTAPFVGLFGTVWGIYHALVAIGVAGQASIDKVAGPVGEALIMTAIGLAVAVPAVLGYNWLVRRNKGALDMLRRFSGDVLSSILHETATAPQQVRPAFAAGR